MPTPAKAKPPSLNASPLLQTLTETDGKRTVGVLTWHVANPSEGVMQVLDVRVDGEFARQGIGSRLLNQAITNAAADCRSRGGKLRRVFVALAHEEQILARAFFTRHGFHHVHTLKDLLRSQDLLTYVKSYD